MSDLDLLKLHADVLFHHDLPEYNEPQKDIVAKNWAFCCSMLQTRNISYISQHQDDASHIIFLFHGFACEIWVGSSDVIGGIYHFQNKNIIFGEVPYSKFNLLLDKKEFMAHFTFDFS